MLVSAVNSAAGMNRLISFSGKNKSDPTGMISKDHNINWLLTANLRLMAFWYYSHLQIIYSVLISRRKMPIYITE